MRDIKGRHDLITQGWTKLGTHTRSNTSVFKSSFQVNMTLMCYLCLRRTSRFLEAVATTRTTTTLAYNTTTHEISCHSARQVPHLMLLESTTLRFTAAVASGFCAIVARRVLSLAGHLPRS